MSVNVVHNPVDIAVSGLRAQALRINVISSNIANAFTTRTASGEPYRRRDVVLATGADEMAGVDVLGVLADMRSDFKRILQPGHPHADKDGYVSLPNVEIPTEIMHLVAASRAYQANAAVLKRYQEIVNATVQLLR